MVGLPHIVRPESSCSRCLSYLFEKPK
jgi:hypothetical protein